MDTKRLYVDFHVLQTVPPSCVNRDDTGSPKTAVYGGAVRARVSSQAWKHAMRVMFTEEMSDAVETGYHTKKGTDLVAEQIKALAPDKDALKLAQKVIADAGIKSDDKGTKALFFMSTAQAKALAELAVEGCKDKKQYKEALKAAPSADMALFGRMVADDPSLNYDAAAQVAHSISLPTPCRTSSTISPPWTTVPRRTTPVPGIWARWNTILPPCTAMRRSMFWSWCARWAQSRRHRRSGRSVRRSSAPCPPASRTALPTAPCRMPFTSLCGRTSR